MLSRARALPTWASQETRALEDIAERSPPAISPFYINRDNRASVTGQWPGLRPRISFVGSRRRDATPSIDACNNTLRNREIVKIGMKRVFRVVPNVMRRRAKRHIRCAYSVNRGRYLPLVPHVHRATPISNTPLPFLLLRPLPAYCLPVNTIRSETPLLIANKCSLFFSLSLSLVFLFVSWDFFFFFLPREKSVSKEERIRNRYIYDTRLSTSISNSGHLVKIRKILSSLKR